MRTLLIATASLATLIAAGACTADQPAPGPQPASTSAAAVDVDDFLAQHDLAGRSVTEIVEALDATNDDRETGPYGSVLPGELILADEKQQVSLPIEDAFYLSVAPYVTGTHECYNHNLASCQGELAQQELDVTIVGEDGQEIFDDQVTTAPNGFAGFWLPKEITATVTVEHDGRTATTEVSTGAEDPTCITTMQLA